MSLLTVVSIVYRSHQELRLCRSGNVRSGRRDVSLFAKLAFAKLASFSLSARPAALTRLGQYKSVLATSP